jgi:predicted amidophosphoribosyltransferase
VPPPPSIDVVSFVPSALSRVRARGFDLPALLAARVARACGKPLVEALDVVRQDEPLAGHASGMERALAVRGRYRARPIAGAVLLIDDVVTTGATLGEATRVLEAAGAVVHATALAHTPLQAGASSNAP